MRAKPALAIAGLGALTLAAAWAAYEDVRLPWQQLSLFERKFPGCVTGISSPDYGALQLRSGFRHFYLAWGDKFPVSEMKRRNSAPAILALTWEPYLKTEEKRSLLGEIAGGRHDAYMRRLAAAIKGYGRPVMLSWGHEPNGDWYSWSGSANGRSPELYIKAWRRMAAVLRAGGGPKLRLVFTVNAEDKPAESWNRFENYYPGGAYADAVGLDVYNWGASREWSSWRRPGQLLKGPYARALALAPDKPLFLSEVASCNAGGSRALWLRRLLYQLEYRYTAVKGLVWFDYNKECDWRLSADETAGIYEKAAADGYFKADAARLAWFFGD
ncbi:MAG TPA: glycosyl hydrolase [Elusimicrobiales bacterium]|nr:glycosyl hydrolase [Elusimicrobiales bacterium]